jgi:hypothetical protein
MQESRFVLPIRVVGGTVALGDVRIVGDVRGRT